MSRLKLRRALRSDIDELTTVAIAAFSQMPQWPYCFPNVDWKQDPEHIEYVKKGIEGYFKERDVGNCELVIVRAPLDSDPKQSKIVAFSVWREVEEPDPNEPLPTFTPTEGIVVRLTECAKVARKARKEVFWNSGSGKRQCQLIEMGTHPDFWRKGAASKMLNVGLAKATKDNVAITVLASPMGRELYARFGFVDLETLRVQVEGDVEYLECFCTAWEPEKGKQ